MFNNRRDDYGRIKAAKCPTCTRIISHETTLYPSRSDGSNETGIVDDLAKSLNSLSRLLINPLTGLELHEMVENLQANSQWTPQDENAKTLFLENFNNLAENISDINYEFDLFEKLYFKGAAKIEKKNLIISKLLKKCQKQKKMLTKLKKKNK